MAKRVTRLEEAKNLFEDYNKTKNVESRDRATQICNDLCMSLVYPPKEKFLVFQILLEYYYELAEEVLSRWRDQINYLQGSELDYGIDLLVKITSCSNLTSHERIYTVVSLYNSGFIHVCYPCFVQLAFDKKMNIEHRLEASRFLFATGEDEEKNMAQECILEIIQDHIYSTKFRYEQGIARFISKTGIASLMNSNKLKIPYDEDFVYTLQIVFFHDEDNDIRYRILSGQHLLQMQSETLSDEDKKEVSNVLLEISENESFNEDIRADAADVVLRLGDFESRSTARKIITKLGYSADGEKKTILPSTMYDNSQNVHNEEIDKCVQIFLSKMISKENSYKLSKYQDVHDEIVKCISDNLNNIDNKKKFLAKSALNRVSIDTATFTEYKATLAEILIHVWSRIHSGEFNKNCVRDLEHRLIDELSDMSSTCSSGHASRFVNVLSTVDDTLRISWGDQIRGNVKGRLQARIRDCKDLDIQASVALGMMEEADVWDRKIYKKFIEKELLEVEKELYKEFVEEGYIKSIDFEDYFNDIKYEWLNIK